MIDVGAVTSDSVTTVVLLRSPHAARPAAETRIAQIFVIGSLMVVPWQLFVSVVSSLRITEWFRVSKYVSGREYVLGQ